jgi:diguanylate cyclase (GGDEF)-like protein/PAS domain S-box-containing protein
MPQTQTIRSSKYATVRRLGLLALLPAFCAMLLALLWYVVLVKLAEEEKRAVKNAISDTNNFVGAFEQYVLRAIRQIDQTSKFVQFEYQRADGRVDLADLASSGLIASETLPLISIADEQGVIVTTTMRTGKGLNIADREHFRVHAQEDNGRLFIGKPVLGRVSGKWTVQMTRRLNRRDGTFAGIIVVSVDPTHFAEYYNKAILAEHGVLSVLGQDGVYRVRRSGDVTTTGLVVDYAKSFARLEQAERDGQAVRGADNVERYVAHRKVAGYPLLVIAEQSREEALAEYNRSRQIYFAAAFSASIVIAAFFALATVLIRRLHEKHLQAAAARATYQAASEGSLDGFYILHYAKGSEGFTVADVNERGAKLLGLSKQHVLGKHLAALLPKKRAAALTRRYLRVLRTGIPIEEEVENRTGVLRVLWLHHQVVPLQDGVAVTVRDISDTKKSKAQLEQLANYDSLTKLPNRHMFQQHLRAALARCQANGKKLAVLFIDLDNFKTVNDTLGHDWGDLLLRSIPARLAQCLRGEDVVCRLGGDEFTVIMEGFQSGEEVSGACKRLVSALAKPFAIKGRDISTNACIGVSIYPDHGTDVATLLKNADLAMYKAKAVSKGSFQFYAPELSERIAQFVSLEESLRGAMDLKQFFLVFQPKIELKRGQISGFEALLRWRHPERGLVPPVEFIPVAEATGLIVPLGEFVLRQACEQIACWQKAGLGDVPVAINVSAHQLRGTELVGMVARALSDFDLRPNLLELELTESAIMEDPEAVCRTLADLKDIGVSISIDDFGTGYSCLASLKRFQVDCLKVDRSFIRDVPGDEDATAILRAIVTMAESLRIGVVAEGVETETQLEFLRELRCAQAQGYYFSRPVIASAVPELVAAYGLVAPPTRERVVPPRLAIVAPIATQARLNLVAETKGKDIPLSS